ncbi:hypothetical protein TNCV_2314911 [Trichonephila clavipes]|nr:hypothetical protein TNCV_2314911 [Trichonephila clavipes]
MEESGHTNSVTSNFNTARVEELIQRNRSVGLSEDWLEDWIEETSVTRFTSDVDVQSVAETWLNAQGPDYFQDRNRYTTPSPVSRWIGEQTRYLLWRACVERELLRQVRLITFVLMRQVSLITLIGVSGRSDDFR